MPALWAYSRAPATWAAMSMASAGGSAPRSSSVSRRVVPSTSSMTMKASPSSRPVSKMPTTLGWASRAAEMASRRKRSRNDGSAASSGNSTFTATARPSTESSASHTSAMPPRAISWRTR